MPNTNTVNGADGSRLYPPFGVFSEQSLPVSSVHGLYLEQSGSPSGFPVLFLHGGPGSQTNPEHRRYFDPDFYHVVMFDQRGCGRSTPAGCTEENTIWHLVEDIEAIRRQLGMNKWLLFGGSWGSTLALAYATSYPQRVAGIVLRGVFLASQAELEWYLNGLRRFIPEAWERLTNGVADNIIQRYHRDVNHADPEFSVAAARRWVEYEQAVMAIGGSLPSSAGSVDRAALLARARVQLHYLAAGCFLREGQLMQAAGGISAPAIVVQGRTDMVCPPLTAFELSRRLAAARLRIIEQAGHSGTGPRLANALRIAADDMREMLPGAA